jgi:hypothetical protein
MLLKLFLTAPFSADIFYRVCSTVLYCTVYRHRFRCNIAESILNTVVCSLKYESVTKSFRTGRLEQELQMVQLSATRCSCIAILWVSLVSFAAIPLYVASQRMFIVFVYFVIDSVRKLLDTTSCVSTLTVVCRALLRPLSPSSTQHVTFLHRSNTHVRSKHQIHLSYAKLFSTPWLLIFHSTIFLINW